jgi:hypothetical protein
MPMPKRIYLLPVDVHCSMPETKLRIPTGMEPGFAHNPEVIILPSLEKTSVRSLPFLASIWCSRNRKTMMIKYPKRKVKTVETFSSSVYYQ